MVGYPAFHCYKYAFFLFIHLTPTITVDHFIATNSCQWTILTDVLTRKQWLNFEWRKTLLIVNELPLIAKPSKQFRKIETIERKNILSTNFLYIIDLLFEKPYHIFTIRSNKMKKCRFKVLKPQKIAKQEEFGCKWMIHQKIDILSILLLNTSIIALLYHLFFFIIVPKHEFNIMRLSFSF